MQLTLALRHLLVRPGRSMVLLSGYAIGVAVMIVLLSVGDAMLIQSRDVSLVGGGELTVLPEGVDVEALRTGGMTGMFFGIDRSRFVVRQLLDGARHGDVVRAVSPLIEGKRVLVTTSDTTWTVRGGADLPTIARAVGSPIRVITGVWGDPARDAAWLMPDRQALYDELDHFHRPSGGDSSWGEWHYFNVVVDETEWWYITLLVGGDQSTNRWGGQVLVTRRTNEGHERFAINVPANLVQYDTLRADLAVGPATVEQRDGQYRVRGSVSGATFDLQVAPQPNGYFPAVELRDDRMTSGYVVPGLVASASGQLCVRGRCRVIEGMQAYHDHNWGTWQGVTWEWGTGRGTSHSILYGGVRTDADTLAASQSPFFLTVVDSAGVRQVYRFDQVSRIGSRPLVGHAGVFVPESLRIVASRLSDTVWMDVAVVDAHVTRSAVAGLDRLFLQMRGHWTARGRAAGEPVVDSGRGFFETWIGADGNGSRR